MAKPLPHPLSLFPISACSQRKMGPGTLPGAPRALTWGGAGAPKASGMAGDPERTCQTSTPPPPARQGLRLITPRCCLVHHSCAVIVFLASLPFLPP